MNFDALFFYYVAYKYVFLFLMPRKIEAIVIQYSQLNYLLPFLDLSPGGWAAEYSLTCPISLRARKLQMNFITANGVSREIRETRNSF